MSDDCESPLDASRHIEDKVENKGAHIFKVQSTAKPSKKEKGENAKEQGNT